MSAKWKSKEDKMFNAIKEAMPELKELQRSKGKYERYDAFGDGVIIELKYRKGDKWENTLIEYSKFQALGQSAAGRKVYYAVYSEGNIYMFDIGILYNEGYDFGWEMRMANATTEFYGKNNNKLKVSKKVGYIDWDKATKVIEGVI